MSSSARQYHARVPRYVFRAEDESLMRFAGMETRGVATRARVRDLSEKGVAFMLSGSDAPEEGDMLKIEFTIPGRSQIACFATVVRVDSLQEWDPDLGTREFKLIACQFRNLPTAYTKALSLGLKGRTKPESQSEPHPQHEPQSHVRFPLQSDPQSDPQSASHSDSRVDWQEENRNRALAFGAFSFSLLLTLAWLATPASQWLRAF